MLEAGFENTVGVLALVVGGFFGASVGFDAAAVFVVVVVVVAAAAVAAGFGVGVAAAFKRPANADSLDLRKSTLNENKQKQKLACDVPRLPRGLLWCLLARLR